MAQRDYCKRCKMTQARGGKFCAICGTDLKEKPQEKKCPKCGEKARATDTYCIECRERI